MMHGAAKKKSNNAQFQLPQAESHLIELTTQKIAWQKLAYVNHNPVEAGFVRDCNDWL